jgi:predicted nucleic acid-binding protein
VILYLDTSFIASLYVHDSNSFRALAQVKKVTHSIPITAIHTLETINAISLCVFRKQLNKSTAKKAKQAFRADIADGVYENVQIPSALIFDRALALSVTFTEKSGCRSLDLLHVAAALELNAKRFWTFDDRQKVLARAVGLLVL